jgi:hypothetical protein
VDLLIIIVLIVLFNAQLLLFSGLPLHPLALLALLLPLGLVGPLLFLLVLLHLQPLGVSPIPYPLGHVLGKGWVEIRDQAEIPLQPLEPRVSMERKRKMSKGKKGEGEGGVLTISTKPSSGRIV